MSHPPVPHRSPKMATSVPSGHSNVGQACPDNAVITVWTLPGCNESDKEIIIIRQSEGSWNYDSNIRRPRRRSRVLKVADRPQPPQGRAHQDGARRRGRLAARSRRRQEVHLEATEREITYRAAGLHGGQALGWPGRLGVRVVLVLADVGAIILSMAVVGSWTLPAWIYAGGGLVLLAVSSTYRPRIPLQPLNELPFLSDGRPRTT
jgi:hypothetical protein